MPHIHDNPDQHDITVSGWIVRQADGEWRCLVHYHRKMDVLMQIGGHIELNETPWQTIAHELEEESGYDLQDLSILQFTSDRIEQTDNVIHPTPFTMNTHLVGNEHYHSDLGFGFVADAAPKHAVQDGESNDLRWLTLDELITGAEGGEVLVDVVNTYRFLLSHIDMFAKVPADSFSMDKPKITSVTYKRGAPGEKS